MGAKPLKGVFEQIMQSFIAPTKIGIIYRAT